MMPDKPTRYYSNMQEESVAKLIGGHRSSNSGAGHFAKGDIFNKDIPILVECKTPATEKESFSIKKEWIVKNKKEAFDTRLYNSAIAFCFAPGKENYFVIDEKLFKFLCEKLEEENKI